MPPMAAFLLLNLVGAPTVSQDAQGFVPSLGTLVARAEPLEPANGVELRHTKATQPRGAVSARTRLEDEPESCRKSIFSTADCTDPVRIRNRKIGGKLMLGGALVSVASMVFSLRFFISVADAAGGAGGLAAGGV